MWKIHCQCAERQLKVSIGETNIYFDLHPQWIAHDVRISIRAHGYSLLQRIRPLRQLAPARTWILLFMFNSVYSIEFSLLDLIRFIQFNLLWSAYGIGQTIKLIFLACGFFFFFFLLSFFLFSSSNLSSRRLDVCRTSTHGVALVRI